MAGDWIKMRSDLQTHPKVVRILSATGTDKFRAIGGLHAVWSVFDAHSEDGVLRGYTPELLDHVVGWQGLSRAMEAVGWLAYDGLETLTLPEFTSHNGQSAKRRAEDQKRKKTSRHSVRSLSAIDEDKKRTREEKRREEEKAKSGATAPADPKKAFWDAAVSCVGESNRGRIGKLAKQHGEEVVARAVAETLVKRPADPMAYVARIVQKAEHDPFAGAL